MLTQGRTVGRSDRLVRGAPQEEIDLMVSEIDADGNGDIDFDGAPPSSCLC